MKLRYILVAGILPFLYIGCDSSTYIDTDGRHLTSLSSSKNFDSVSSEIEFVSQINLEGNAVDIALSKDKNVAYIASGEGGLEVVDVSDPYHPRYIESFDLYEYTNYVEVDGNRVYAAYVTENTRAYMDIKAFDISNPTAPIYVGSNINKSTVAHYQDKSNGVLVEVDDDGVVLYRSGGDRYIEAGRYNLGDHAYAVRLKGDFILVANGRDGLTILRSDIAGSSGRFISN